MNSRKPIYSKNLLPIIGLVVVILVLCVISFAFYVNKRVIIGHSEISIGNDIRDKYLNVVVTWNDTVLKFKSLDKNKRISFKSNNGNYNLKIFIKDTEVISKKFQISDNKPKYIYAFFESVNSNYYKYYDSIVSIEIAKRVGDKTLSRNELRKTIIEIKQGITIADLEKLGYEVKKEKIKLYVRDRPFMID